MLGLSKSLGPLSAQTSRLVREGAFVLLGQVGVAVGTVFGIRVITEVVSPAIFGTAALMLGLSALGQAVLSTPLLQAVLRFYPEFSAGTDRYALKQTARRYLFVSALVQGGVIVAGGLVWLAIGGSMTLFGFGMLAALAVAETMKATEIAFLSAERAQKEVAAWNATDSLVRPLLAVGMVLLLGGAVEVILMGYAVAVTVDYLLFVRFLRPGRSPDAPEVIDARRLRAAGLKYAMPLVFLAVVGWLENLSSRYVIGALLGPTEVGLFVAVAGLTAMPFLMAQGVIELTLRPTYFEAVSSGNRILEDKTIALWLTLVTTVSCIGVAVILLAADVVALLFLAENYRSAAWLMPWIAVGYAFLAISYVLEKRCYAHKKTRLVLMIQMIGAVVAVPTLILLTMWFGLLGTALSIPGYFGLQLCVAYVVFRHVGRSRRDVQ